MKLKKPKTQNRVPVAVSISVVPQTEVKLDLGCGPNKREGFIGCDIIKFPGVDVVANLREQWPWEDNSISEVHCAHCLEHFTASERVHFVNELYRVLKPGAKATVIVPHWSSCRAYGDPTHQWPPVSEFFFYYLKREWRKANAPHTDSDHIEWGFDCDFEVTWGFALEQTLLSRNTEYQQHAITFFKEACQDMIATFVKR